MSFNSENWLFDNGQRVLRFAAALRADGARRKVWRFAVRANFPDQGIALFFESPVTRNFHLGFPSHSLTIIGHLCRPEPVNFSTNIPVWNYQ